MKKAILALLAIGVLVGVVLVGWELVAKPGPLRKTWWRIRAAGQEVFEARIQLNLRQEISDEELAFENQLLDSEEVLLPVAVSLGLAESWQLAGDWAAVERLAENSELRRGDAGLTLILAVRDPDKEMAGAIIEPLGKSFLARKQAAEPPPNPAGGGAPSGVGP